MARNARITRIQTGAERAAGDNGHRRTDDDLDMVRTTTDEESARGDKIYGPGTSDGMSPRGWFRRR